MQSTEQSLVTIVIATYNRARSLPLAVESAINQAGASVEIVIVDDGSTDETEAVVRRMNDGRIRYIRLPENAGASAARNRGIREAKGEYVMVWDSDDTLDPHAVVTLLKGFAVHPECAVVSAPARAVRDGAEIAVTVPPETLLSLPQVLCKYVGNYEKVRLVRRDAYLNAPYVSRNIDFIVGARLRAQGEWLHLAEPLGTINIDNPDSLTHVRKRFDAKRSADRATHLDAYLRDFGTRLLQSCPDRYAALAYSAAIAFSCGGARNKALSYARSSWRHAPLAWRSYVALASAAIAPLLPHVFGIDAITTSHGRYT